MLVKYNKQEYQRSHTQEQQRFGLRKLSIGVASVLLGTSIVVAGNTTAHASSNAELADSNDQSVATVAASPVTHQGAVALNSKQSTVTETTQATSDQSGASVNSAHQVASPTAARSAQATSTSEPAKQPATVDLTFVDDDNNGAIIDSPYLPSENNGHHYAHGFIGEKISTTAYNNGTRSVDRMLRALTGRHDPYVLNGSYTLPTEFTDSLMTVQIHLKHRVETHADYPTKTITRTIHYRRAYPYDGSQMVDDDGKLIPDYQVQYEVTPVVVIDKATGKQTVTYTIKNLQTGKVTTIENDGTDPITIDYDQVASPTVTDWIADEAAVGGHYQMNFGIDSWKVSANDWQDLQTVTYKYDESKLKIGDVVPKAARHEAAIVEISADGTRMTVTRTFYYGFTDDSGDNLDHPEIQHYGGSQSLEFTREKATDSAGNTTYSPWQAVTTNTFPKYVYQEHYGHPQGYDLPYGYSPAVTIDPNADLSTLSGITVYDPYGPTYKVSIIDDTNNKVLNVYGGDRDNYLSVPEAGDGYQHTRDAAEQTRRTIYAAVAGYQDQGYVVVSDDFGQISTNNAANQSHSEGIEDYAKYVYTIHLAKKATPQTEQKTVKRIVHFVADNPAHDQLQASQTQLINYTTSYFTDPDGNLVNAKQLVDKDGNVVKDDAGNPIYIVDSANQTTPRKTWTVLTPATGDGVTVTGNQASYQQVRQDFIDVPAGALAGHWQIERAARDAVDGQQLATKTAPVEAVDNDLPDGTVGHVYLVYTQPQTPETIDPNDAGKVTPATPGNTPGSGAGTATSASVAVSPAAAQLSAADSQNAQGKHLPQTGQANSRGLLALGLTAFLTAIGLGAVNRKRQD